MKYGLEGVKTPCYIVDERLLIKNLEILKDIEVRTGCHILLAQKAFAMYATYTLIGKYLSGVTSSGLLEAKLGREELGKEVHTYAPAFREDDFEEIMACSDHIVFNSFKQWQKYKGRIQAYPKTISCGLRLNPEYSEIETDIYNPCCANSRLGITEAN